MSSHSLPTRRQALLVCTFVALTALMCAGLLGAAALVPAPPVVLPLVIVVCIGSPMLAAWELRPSIAVLRASRKGAYRGRRARWLVAEMRRYLDALPETQHPLDG